MRSYALLLGFTIFYSEASLPTDLMGDPCINIPLYNAGNGPHNLVAWRLPHPSRHCAQNAALDLHRQTSPSTSAQKNSQRLRQQYLNVMFRLIDVIGLT